MAEPMILIVASGILTTLLGVGFGCLVLELAVRVLRHKLIEQPAKGRVNPQRASSQMAGSRTQVTSAFATE